MNEASPVAEASIVPTVPALWLYRSFASLTRMVPLRLSYAVAVAVADAFYYVWRSKRESTCRNFSQVFSLPPDHPKVRRVARQSFHHYGRYIAELLHVQGVDLGGLRQRMVFRGREYLDEAVGYKRGVIFVSAHFGAMEVGSSAAPMLGYRITAAVQPLKPKLLMDWIAASRARLGVTLIDRDKSGRKLLRVLRRGGLIALVIDMGIQETGGVEVSFFGSPTVFPAGPAKIARWSGAPLVFALARRTADGRFIIQAAPPVLPRRSDDAQRDIQVTTQELVDIFADFVRQYPEQWYMFRDMWPWDGAQLPSALRSRA